MEQGGGFVPLEYSLTQVPQFTLYGDGTVIYQRQDPSLAPGERPPLAQARMDAEQIDALLRFALGPGRLEDARDAYEDFTIADAPSTFFTLDAAGIRKSVRITALGEVEPSGPDATHRRGFQQLAAILNDFGSHVEQGNATDAGVYAAEAYRATLMDVGESTVEPIEWPFTSVEPSDFKAESGGGFRVAVISAEDAGKVTEVPSGGAASIGLRMPDDTVLVLALRPLLPDELPR